MTSPPRETSRILEFWQAMEFFSPPPVPRVAPGSAQEPVERVGEDTALPWDAAHRLQRLPLPPRQTRRFTVYGGVYRAQDVSGVLEGFFGRDPEAVDERVDGESCLFALLVTAEGRPLLDSVVVSSCAWAVGRTLNPGPSDARWLSGFEQDAERLAERIRARFAPQADDDRARELAAQDVAVGRPLGVQDLRDVTRMVARALGVEEALKPAEIRVRADLVGQTREHAVDDHDFLNSFFLRDLGQVAGEVRRGNLGAGLRAYLTPDGQVRRARRVDVRTDAAAVEQQLAPALFPAGRWPGRGHHPLVHSQQLAVNSALAELRGGGLFAVNGPPGTGKTTLLRDLVAAVVVERASRLAELRTPAEAFGPPLRWKTGKFTRVVSTWREDLRGFEIVVASANNGAVENVTRELPAEDAIDPAWHAHTDYFPAYGTRVLGGPAWGLIAAPLGNKANRADFLRRFWHAEPRREERPAPDTPPTPEDGFRRLLEHLSGRPVDWPRAVKRFRAALRAEAARRAEREAAFALGQQQRAGRARRAELGANAEQLRAQQPDLVAAHRAAEAALAEALADFHAARARREDHRRTRPGALETVFSLGRSSRAWREREGTLTRAVDEAEALVGRQRGAAAALGQQVQQTARSLERLVAERSALEARLGEGQRKLDALGFPAGAADEAARELSSPWVDAAWNEARARVFLEALELHRAFTAATADTLRKNLHAATDILSGSVPPDAPQEAVQAAWASLFFVVPVVSTTFASFDRLFAHLGREALGWLLIDEAGQAVPQAAAGAIWRARRTVVVGDPLQLEPVVTVPFTAQQALRRHFQVEETWLPGRTSVQQLADRVNRYGTTLPVGDTSLWVGSPLRVHRRCDRPMFTVANEIAYGGMMVYGTPPRDPLPLPPSQWLDVTGPAGEGHDIPAEGAALQELLGTLEAQGVARRDIFVLSPFRSVARALKLQCRDVAVGTVHTMQGKESDVVILVLGGNPARPGAKAWAPRRGRRAARTCSTWRSAAPGSGCT